MIIEIDNSIDKKEWHDFVLEHPNGNIFQTPFMNEVYKRTKNYMPIVLATKDESNNIIALLQAVIIKEINGILGGFTSRSIIQGGPLYTSIATLKPLMENYDEFVRNKVIFTQIRNMGITSEIKNILESEKYSYDDHLNYLIDLKRSSDEIWEDIHKSRRKGITRAKKNLIIKKVETEDELNDCYSSVEETYRNVKIPLADKTLFENAFELLSPSGIADFYIAIEDKKVVGTRITLKFKGIVHDWYAGSKKEIPYINEALVWHILQENCGKQNVFEFGGAGHPKKPYGVREFKKRFGGGEVNFGRYEKIHSHWKKKGLEAAFNIYKKFR